VSRRDRIAMSAEEVAAFLDEERTVVCATNGVRGWPHLMPLWYVVRDTHAPGGAGTGRDVWAWTYAKSQKVRNLERDPRATLQVEAGDSYEELRGVMLECDVVVHRDTDDVEPFGRELYARYTGAASEAHLHPGVLEMIEAQAPKRVALRFVERSRATWDHRKLGGGY
jgi:PPOX class probable F420-dependent enzyme